MQKLRIIDSLALCVYRLAERFFGTQFAQVYLQVRRLSATVVSDLLLV